MSEYIPEIPSLAIELQRFYFTFVGKRNVFRTAAFYVPEISF